MPPSPHPTHCCDDGHNFVARFSEIAASEGQIDALGRTMSDEFYISEAIANLTSRTYMGDICTRCGMTARVNIDTTPKEQV